MGRYILRRLIYMIPVFIGVSILTFFLTNILPGDPAHTAAGRYAKREQIQATRERLGLDKPLPVQYVLYMGRLARGDFGQSLSSKQDVSKELSIYFPATVELTMAAMLMVIIIGIPIGIITGSGRSPLVNSLVMLLALIGVGMPMFWSGLVFQLIFFGKLHILPLSGRLSIGMSAPPLVTHIYTIDALIAGQWDVFKDALLHLVLPGFTLALGSIASVARITHASVVAVMRKDYIRTARAKGIVEFLVLSRHALKNALLPTVTMIGMQFGWLLGGAILVENIFSWGGLGTYAWIGIFRSDIPVIMGIVLITTVTFMFLTMITDISYAYLDPRIAYD